MACARCGGFLVSERWRGFVDNAREMDLQNMRCVKLWMHRRSCDRRESSYC